MKMMRVYVMVQVEFQRLCEALDLIPPDQDALSQVCVNVYVFVCVYMGGTETM